MLMENRRDMVLIIAISVQIVLVAFGIWERMTEEDSGGTGHGQEMKAQVPIKPPLYQNLGTFVVNLDDENNEIHYMQIDVTLMTRNPRAAKSLEGFVPVFRNAFLELLSSQSYQDMQVTAKREKLREQVRALGQKVMSEKVKTGKLEDVLFTSFVIQ